MADDRPYDYLYVVEWDASVHRPPYTVTHAIKLNAGVDPADFERFMLEEAFPRAGKVSTRAGGVAAQYLLVDAGDPPDRFEMLDVSLEAFGARTTQTAYRLLGRWSKAADG